MRFIRTTVAVVLSCALLNGIAFAKGGGGFGGGGGGSFGGGARSFSAPTISAPAAKSFSLPTTSAPRAPAPAAITAPAAAPARAPVMFDSGAARAKATEDSRANFRANSPEAPKPAPAATATTSTSHTSWADRPIFPQRQADPPRTDYRPTSSWTPTRTVYVERQVTSSGGTDMWFWMWLMEHNNQRQRDEWVYNNRNRVSTEQMDELRRRDSGIDERLRKLEAEGKPRDAEYRIPESDYKGKTVTAPAETHATSSGWKTFWLTIGLMLFFGALIYLVFFKRFNTRRSYA